MVIQAVKQAGADTRGIFKDQNKHVGTSVACIVATHAHPPVKFSVTCQGANERIGKREETHLLQRSRS